ncbi:MAG: ferrous iron transport protein B [Filifactoraceae bacterium]
MMIKIALAGNPNCGKTTLFNNLTGSAQYVGNWPGVTVEKKEGRLKGDKEVVIQDLPGIYSLSPYTLEEVVARNYLVNDKPDVILNIVDGSNIERNLYLTTQLIELGIPTVVALNMMDIVRKTGDSIDSKKLAKALGCNVLEMSAIKGDGTLEAASVAVEVGKSKSQTRVPCHFQGSVEHAIAHIEESIQDFVSESSLRWFAIKIFERDEKVKEQLNLQESLVTHLEEHIVACENELDDDAESIITNQRYAHISKIISQSVVKKARANNLTNSDKIDKIVTNRFLALPIFALIMFVVYYISVTTIGSMLTDFTNDTLFGEWILPSVAGFLENINVAPWLSGLIVDGIIGGVGSVLGFVPQMLVLFLLLSLLEDCGYMTRVAFIMDRIFRKFGLSGKSFIPMLIGSGCSVPGIMASRTIEQELDRRMTIMTTSFIPCGAKVPIIGLIAGTLFGGAWWIAPSAYFIGVAAIVISGIILKKTKAFSGDVAPFVMELPQYHIPTASNILRSTWERGWSFIKRAGTVILLASIVIWFLSNFGFVDGSFTIVEDMNISVLAVIGNAIAPIFIPLGFGHWQGTVATIMGLVAKEEVVGVFGVLFGVTGDALELVEGGSFEQLSNIAGHFTQLSAYSFLIFNLLCAPCFAAMGAIKREMSSGKWTFIAIAYLTIFAYSISLIVYQFGLLVSTKSFTLWTAMALAVLVILVYLLLREPYEEKIRKTEK